MTREQYIEMRTHNQLDMGLCYEYYQEQSVGHQIKDMKTFLHYFQPFIQMYGPDFAELIKYYDSKFNLNIMRDKDNQIIKIY